jgi:hypothetical protein
MLPIENQQINVFTASLVALKLIENANAFIRNMTDYEF